MNSFKLNRSPTPIDMHLPLALINIRLASMGLISDVTLASNADMCFVPEKTATVS